MWQKAEIDVDNSGFLWYSVTKRQMDVYGKAIEKTEVRIMRLSFERGGWGKRCCLGAVLFLTAVFLVIQSGRFGVLPWNDIDSWRQTDTYSIARNFVQFDMDPLRPQLNYDGVADNYSQLELQIIPFISALLFRLTGTMDPVICRVLCLIFFMGSAVFVYLLLRDFAGEVPAVFGYGVYLFLPLSLVMAASIQPEACALFAYCGGVYFLRRFQLTVKYRFLAAASALTAVAIMEKMPAAFVGLLFLYVLLSVMGRSFYKNPWFYYCGAITLLPPVLLIVYGSANSTFRFIDGIATKHILTSEIFSVFTRSGLRFFYDSFQTYFGWAAVVLAVLGALLLLEKEYRFVLVWTLAFALECATIVAVIKFPHYLVFILPVCAMLAALAVKDMLGHRRSLVAAACVFTVFSFWLTGRELWQDIFESDMNGEIGSFIEMNTDFNDGIAIGSMHPVCINAANRRGYRANINYYDYIPSDPAGELEYFAEHGVRWMVVVQGAIDWDSDGSYLGYLQEHYPVYAVGEYCTIYDLQAEVDR